MRKSNFSVRRNPRAAQAHLARGAIITLRDQYRMGQDYSEPSHSRAARKTFQVGNSPVLANCAKV